MTLGLLSLPLEIRLMIYGQLFSPRIVLVEAGTQESHSSLIPSKATIDPHESCSSQILRVCKQIRQEAEPILCAKTHFYIRNQAFAGFLPLSMTNGSSYMPKIKNMTWQLDCDLMKHFYEEDFSISSRDLAQLNNLELRCQAENWKGSYIEDCIAPEAFTRGREQMIYYGQKLQSLMNGGCNRQVSLIENRSGLSRGRMALRLTRREPILCDYEELIV